MTTATWGVNENRTRVHAYEHQSAWQRRTTKPKALCGKAWSPTQQPTVPVGDALPLCRDCARLAHPKAPE